MALSPDLLYGSNFQFRNINYILHFVLVLDSYLIQLVEMASIYALAEKLYPQAYEAIYFLLLEWR